MWIKSLTETIPRIFSLRGLTGPIFDKELRISSRRRRNYFLRIVYALALAVFVVMVWLNTIDGHYRSTFTVAHMGEAGKYIITTVLWFQFVATQLIAIVMLSTAINDEIYKRTLGVLMTTSINSFQIVMGKLCSKGVQILLLLAISLPILAIVRVFGGVSWDYLIKGLCVTVTAVLFCASLSLYFSIGPHRPYVVIVRVVITLASIYLLLPAIGGLLLFKRVPEDILFPILLYCNPFALFQWSTFEVLDPTKLAFMPFVLHWPIHCAIMAILTLLILSRSVQVVRKVALRSAIGEIELKRKTRKTARNAAQGERGVDTTFNAPLRPVRGAPLVWKEVRAPILQGGQTQTFLGVFAAVVALGASYVLNARNGSLSQDIAQEIYIQIFFCVGLITVIMLAATSVTKEKESQSWPLLLTTGLGDWQIILSKAMGVFRRSLSIWLFLAAHIILFAVLFRYIRPIAVAQLLFPIVGAVAFLIGTGVYFSSRFKHSTASVLATFAMALGVWAVLPGVSGLATDYNAGNSPSMYNLAMNPMVQVYVIMNGGSGRENMNKQMSRLRYRWPHRQWRSIGKTSTFLLLSNLAHVLAGLIFLWRAKAIIRQKVF
jgi:ABC-type transport system involved in multi-copper enzyme maturation permease subunit